MTKANEVKPRGARSKLLLSSLFLAAFSAPATGLAADDPAVKANVSFTTNYVYRGITQTGAKPALQGGFDYAHASGFYAGAWGSNISWLSDFGAAAAASLEVDTYAGFRKAFSGDFSYDVGFLRYNYPGLYPLGATKPDTNEVYGAIGWKWLTAKYSRSLSNLFGVADSSGSSYVDLSASYTIEEPGVTLGAHYGRQTFSGAGNDALTYSDYKLSASRDFSGFVLGLAYSSTNTRKGIGGIWNIAGLPDGSNIDLGESALVLSVTRSF